MFPLPSERQEPGPLPSKQSLKTVFGGKNFFCFVFLENDNHKFGSRIRFLRVAEIPAVCHGSEISCF